MAAHFRTLAWEIPWTEEPGGLQSLGSKRIGLSLATEQLPREAQQEMSCDSLGLRAPNPLTATCTLRRHQNPGGMDLCSGSRNRKRGEKQSLTENNSRASTITDHSTNRVPGVARHNGLWGRVLPTASFQVHSPQQQGWSALSGGVCEQHPTMWLCGMVGWGWM